MQRDASSDAGSGAGVHSNVRTETLFISRAGSDAAAGEWIAQVLVAAGYQVILQQWSFANKSFINQMQAALEDGTRIVALLSPEYLKSDFCAAEWQSVLADDPLNRKSRLIVLRIGACAPSGLLKALMYWDLVGVDEPEARRRIVLAAAAGNETRTSPPPVATADPPPPGGRVENNLPGSLTSFIERAEILAQITAHVTHERLVTLLGAGGVGKTRTAIKAAQQLGDTTAYPDGIWFVDFAPLTSPAYVGPQVAAVLGVRDETDAPLTERICAAVRTKQMLLIFDNCEHVVAEARSIADAIVRTSSGVRILATSREMLGAIGECVYRLPALAAPPDGAGLTAAHALRFESVALFVARAQAADPRFALTDANAALVAEICRRLDGIALAIELAAPRLKLLSLAELAHKLDERFRLLTGGSKTALARQQTLRALIDWSYNLLAADEARLFRRLSIFDDGWTLAAATAICADADAESDEFAMLDMLTSLADKSLVVVEFMDENRRMRLLESMREYGRERLRDAGEWNDLAGRRAHYFGAFAGDGKAVASAVEHARLAVFETELENIRGALRWALEDGNDINLGARTLIGLGRYWYLRNPREAQRWCELARTLFATSPDRLLSARIVSALAAMLPHGSYERIEATHDALAECRGAGDPILLARALCSYGEQLAPLQRYAQAQTAYEEALALARTVPDDWTAARALAGLGALASDQNDIEHARSYGDAAIRLFTAVGASEGVAYVSIMLGEADYTNGDIDRAIDITQQARAAYGDLRNDRSSAGAANNLAAFALVAERIPEARSYARDAISLLRADRHPLFLADAIGCAALVATLAGDVERGALLLGYSQATFSRLAHGRGQASQRCYARCLELLEHHFGDDVQHRLAQGAGMSEDRAIEEALAA